MSTVHLAGGPRGAAQAREATDGLSRRLWATGSKKAMLNIARDDPRMARSFRELLESGAFRPLIDRRYRLDEIVEAYRYVETGQKVGNVVVSLQPST